MPISTIDAQRLTVQVAGKARLAVRWSLALLLSMLVLSPAQAAPQDCVILLHGLARSSYSMGKLESVLQDEGYLVANIDYPSREEPIETLAVAAVNQGLDACRDGDARTIHFVTHSMGGILVRYFLAHHTIAELGRVVMLGPPNQGSEIVDEFAEIPGFATFNGPAGLQLGTGPDSLPNRLGPVSYPVGVIAGTESVNPLLSATLPDQDDGKVTVERTRVDGMTDFIAIPATHSFMMRNAEVIHQSLVFLEHGKFAHETVEPADHEEAQSAMHRE